MWCIFTCAHTPVHMWCFFPPVLVHLHICCNFSTCAYAPAYMWWFFHLCLYLYICGVWMRNVSCRFTYLTLHAPFVAPFEKVIEPLRCGPLLEEAQYTTGIHSALSYRQSSQEGTNRKPVCLHVHTCILCGEDWPSIYYILTILLRNKLYCQPQEKFFCVWIKKNCLGLERLIIG